MNVAIVGASARAAAYSTVRAGHSPIAADLFADGDLCDLCTTSVVRPYPDGFADWLATLDVDGWFYTGALENYPHLVDRLATLRPLWGNPGQVLQRVRDPWQLAAELQHDALRPPEMRRSVEGLPTDGSWLVKTNRGSSGSGVRSWRGPSVPSEDYVAQRRMEGAPIGAVCVCNGSDARVLGITRQLIGCDWTGCGPFQYAGSIGPHETPARLREQIVRTARHLAQQRPLAVNHFVV